MTSAIQESLRSLAAAVDRGQISPATAANIRHWLTAPGYEAFTKQISEHLATGQWAALEAAFWTVLPFGTAGRRGPMYPIGSATINDRTIGESAQALADFVRGRVGASARARCAIGYDVRNNSRHFAELCAEVMTAADFTVLFLDGFRSTPELSFTIRAMHCDCGIMVSASHNPPTDNAVKIFGPTGGQMRPSDVAELTGCLERVTDIRRTTFATALAAGQILFCQRDIDSSYQAAVLDQSFPGPRDAKILYSPLHGVGLTSVLPVLRADGFTQVEVFGPHATPDGNFPNVPGGSANPEDPAVVTQLIAEAERIGADLAIASDPDADRIGCAAPARPGGAWKVLTGNQIGVLLADYVLRRRGAIGALSSDHYLIKTQVTTEMTRRVADRYGVQTYEVPTGFKWIGGLVDERGPERFVMGIEEAHGYMVGDYVRDKDAAVAAMLLAELAAELKAQGRTLFQELDRLYREVGYHAEHTFTLALPGADGLEKMRRIMKQLRADPPKSLAGLAVTRIQDHDGTAGDLLFFDLESAGNYAAVRPSGTEPKIKFYLFAYRPPGSFAAPERVEREVRQQLDAMGSDLRRAAEA